MKMRVIIYSILLLTAGHELYAQVWPCDWVPHPVTPDDYEPKDPNDLPMAQCDDSEDEEGWNDWTEYKNATKFKK